MRPRCPQCGGQPLYEEGGSYVCMMGGHRWPITGAKPIIVYKRSEEEDMEKPTSGKKGKCVNCEREKFIADKEGLCSSCHNAASEFSKGSGAWADALADVKKRLTDNPSRRGRGTVAKSKAPAAAPVIRAKSECDAACEASCIGCVPDAPIPYVSSADENVIKTLTGHRDFHLHRAEKYNKAIDLLS